MNNLTGLDAQEAKLLFEQLAAHVIKENKVRRVIKRLDPDFVAAADHIYRVGITGEDSSGGYVGTVLIPSWDKNNRVCLISTEFKMTPACRLEYV